MRVGFRKWVCLGDSITADPNGYVGVCAARLLAEGGPNAPEVVNAGVSGDRSVDMRARFERDVMAYRPDFVSISVGVNDVWHGFYDFEREEPLAHFDAARGVPLATFLESVGSMIGAAKGAQVLLVAPTPIGEDRENRENRFLADYVEGMESLARERGCLYCPMNGRFWEALDRGRTTDPHFTLTTDGVHMNARGVEVMAGAVFDALAASRMIG